MRSHQNKQSNTLRRRALRPESVQLTAECFEMAPRKAKSPPPVSGSVRTPRSTRKSAAAQAATAGEGTPSSKGLFKLSGRPALPVEHKNDMLGPKGKVYQCVQVLAGVRLEQLSQYNRVKEQTLTLEHPAPAERIVIFRQKVPTPKGTSLQAAPTYWTPEHQPCNPTDLTRASSFFRP